MKPQSKTEVDYSTRKYKTDPENDSALKLAFGDLLDSIDFRLDHYTDVYVRSRQVYGVADATFEKFLKLALFYGWIGFIQTEDFYESQKHYVAARSIAPQEFKQKASNYDGTRVNNHMLKYTKTTSEGILLPIQGINWSEETVAHRKTEDLRFLPLSAPSNSSILHKDVTN